MRKCTFIFVDNPIITYFRRVKIRKFNDSIESISTYERLKKIGGHLGCSRRGGITPPLLPPSISRLFQFWWKEKQKSSSAKCLQIFRASAGTEQLSIYPQFYIQLLYRPHFGPWLLPFGLLGSKREFSETTEFLLR